MKSLMRSASSFRDRPAWLIPGSSELSVPRGLVALLALIIAVWTFAILRFESVPFAILHPMAHGGIEAASTFAMVFGALALTLFPEPGEADRMRWVALALLILSTAGITTSLLVDAFPDALDANERLYISIVIRITAIGLLAVGLAMPRCPRFTGRSLAVALLGLVSIASIVVILYPALSRDPSFELAGEPGNVVLSEFTAWHWLFSAVPLTLAVVIVIRQLRPATHEPVRMWLVIAVVLLAGSQLHNMLWPSLYSPIATTADVLRTGFAATVLFGAVLELRGVALERAARLAEEREYARRLEELQTLRSDFTRMVAHELSNPLAAISRYADILRSNRIDPDQHGQIVRGIEQEADLLRNLIVDVHNAAAVERDDFSAAVRPVPLRVIMSDAVSYAQTIHGLKIVAPEVESILVAADPERIGQVMRNLLTNAAKYSTSGTPVEILATVTGNRVQISVKDHGPGIHPDDQKRIFEKYGRGRRPSDGSPPGLGLGLYISRRILHLHDSDLKVTSTVGEGAVFSFDLGVTG